MKASYERKAKSSSACEAPQDAVFVLNGLRSLRATKPMPSGWLIAVWRIHTLMYPLYWLWLSKKPENSPTIHHSPCPLLYHHWCSNVDLKKLCHYLIKLQWFSRRRDIVSPNAEPTQATYGVQAGYSSCIRDDLGSFKFQIHGIRCWSVEKPTNKTYSISICPHKNSSKRLWNSILFHHRLHSTDESYT